MTKRILSVCLALVLLLGVLAGCSKKEAPDGGRYEEDRTERYRGQDLDAVRVSGAVF